MKFFIDTANIEEIRDAEEMGVIKGSYNKSFTYCQGRS